MKTLIKLEELALAVLSIYLFSLLPFAWWVYPAFIVAPDLSLLGLLAGKRAGAFTYNLIHHRAVALIAYILGNLLGIPVLSLIGVLLFGHSSLDRALGRSLMQISSQSQPALESLGQSA